MGGSLASNVQGLRVVSVVVFVLSEAGDEMGTKNVLRGGLGMMTTSNDPRTTMTTMC